MLLLASAVSWTMFSLGVVLMIFILMRRSWRYQRENRRSARKAAAIRPDAKPRTPLVDAPLEVLRWQVEMHDIARELKAELDSKMSALQALIRMAQQQTQQLDTAIQRAEMMGISTCRDTLETVERLGESPGALPDAMLPRIDESSVAELIKPSNQRSRVYSLHDDGHDPKSIAERMDLAVGEVELILSVRHPKQVHSE